MESTRVPIRLVLRKINRSHLFFVAEHVYKNVHDNRNSSCRIDE